MFWKATSFLSVFFVASLLFFTMPFQAHAALIGHWTFDVGDIDWSAPSGQIKDVSGNGRDGTVHNLTSSNATTTAQIGGAVEFSGAGTYVNIPTAGSFPPSGNANRTLCFWIKPSGAATWGDNHGVLGWGEAGSPRSFFIDMDTYPNIQAYTYQYDLTPSLVPGDGNYSPWIQACWVWNGSTHTSTIYGNGVFRDSLVGGAINTTRTDVYIGKTAVDSGQFSGIIDDVRIYDEAFTADGINNLYKNGILGLDHVASTTGETTATVTWDTGVLSDSTVWYGTSSGAYTTSTSSAALVTSHSLGLANLSLFTTYYFVAVSKDGDGSTATSSEQTFKTTDLTAPTIISVVANVTAPTTATITWVTSENASTRGAYGLTSAYTAYSNETDTSPRVTSPHSVAFSGLLACTTYHYAVVSRDAALNVATSSDRTFTTTGCAGGGSPTSATSTSITSSNGGSTNLVDSGKTFTVSLPSNATATSSSVVIQVQATAKNPVLSELGTPASVPNGVGSIVFDVKAIINGSTILDSFDHPVTITYTYTDSDVSGLDESTFWLYHYHDGAWEALDDCSVNTGLNTITCTTPNFSIFGLFGSSLSTSGSSGGGSSLPWCSGPSAPGWSAGLPKGGCGNGASAQSSATPVTGLCPAYTFTRSLRFGMTGEDVRALQRLMNCLGFTLADTGPGSPGKETNLFVDRTYGAVIKFQETYLSEILTPISANKGTGIFAEYSRKKAGALTGISY